MSRRAVMWLCVLCVGWSGCRRGDGLRKGSIVLEGIGERQSLGTQKPSGKVVAVLVGINTFKDRRFRALRYAEKDARDMKEYLESMGVKSRDIKLLVGEEATLVQVKAALGKWLRQRAGREDAVFVFVSTHGEKLEGGNFLVMYDSDAVNLEYSGLSGGFLEDALKRMRVRQQMVVLDTCFSRAVASEYIASLGRKSNFLPNTHGTMFRGENRVVFTSSDGNEESLEPRNLGNGLYTHYLLKGLRGEADKNADKCITAQEIQDYVSDKVSDEARKLGATQTPSWRPDIVGKGILLVRMPGCGQRVALTGSSGSSQGGETVVERPPRRRPTLRWIPAGTFTMGSPSDEVGRDDSQESQHNVQISQGFWMQETEVTQHQYKALMGSHRSHFEGCANCPVEKVSWHEAAMFANLLSEREGRKKCFRCNKSVCDGVGNQTSDYIECEGWRLPTEAEWEYAARAGTTTAFHWGHCLDTKKENFDGAIGSKGQCENKNERKGRTVSYQEYAFANSWGLRGMHGNVKEWVYDWHQSKSHGFFSFVFSFFSWTVSDPMGAQIGNARVVRGGSWNEKAIEARSAARHSNRPDGHYNNVGFRLVVSGKKL